MDGESRISPPTGLSGLSLPDARYEHTNIRASAANLTSWRRGDGSQSWRIELEAENGVKIPFCFSCSLWLINNNEFEVYAKAKATTVAARKSMATLKLVRNTT